MTYIEKLISLSILFYIMSDVLVQTKRNFSVWDTEPTLLDCIKDIFIDIRESLRIDYPARFRFETIDDSGEKIYPLFGFWERLIDNLRDRYLKSDDSLISNFPLTYWLSKLGRNDINISVRIWDRKDRAYPLGEIIIEQLAGLDSPLFDEQPTLKIEYRIFADNKYTHIMDSHMRKFMDGFKF